MTVNDSFSINGVNDVTYKSGDGSSTSTVEFFNGFMGYLSQYISGGEFLDSTVTLTGNNWTLSTLRFGAEGGNHVTITDKNDNSGRRIDYLKLGESSDVTLISTRVKYIEGGEGGQHDVTLGSESTKSVDLYGTKNKVTTGDGYLANLTTENDTVVNVNGDAGSISLRHGDDTLRFNAGWTEFAKIRDGNDTVTVKSGANIGTLKANANEGEVNANDVTVKDGGDIKFFTSSYADNTIDMQGSGRVRTISTFEGDNDITSQDRWITSIDTWESTNSIHIGNGGVGSITMGSDSKLAHDVTVDGYFGQIQIWENDKATITTGAEGGGIIDTRGGNDKVTTGDGWVATVLTGEGNDTVAIGQGGIGFLGTWNGNDKIKVGVMADRSQWVNGDDGTDTLDFSAFDKKVTFSLDLDGQLQNVTKPDDFNNNVAGQFAQTGIENLTGGSKNDDLTGDDGKNKLVGKGGDDILGGGKGKDKLQGDNGNDTFVFGKKGGTDTVLDFVQGEDVLQIEDHSGGFAALDISNSSGDRSIVYDGGTIKLDGEAGLTLTEADFAFV